LATAVRRSIARLPVSDFSFGFTQLSREFIRIDFRDFGRPFFVSRSRVADAFGARFAIRLVGCV
jgi:hypothetical protein